MSALLRRTRPTIFFQNFLRTCRFIGSDTMDSDTEEDMLYYSHQKLSSLIEKSSDRDAAIEDYLINLTYQPVKDFQRGLEWFNVSEPISFHQHLRGKIVVLDFFTYCCINCMHILPDLREIEEEFSVEDGLVVIGVHSAKFENEKNSKNILAAVQRYGIAHPVVNDAGSDMWKKCEVHCWPTLLVLGPTANPIVMLMGEGHKANLRLYIRAAIGFYARRGQLSRHALPLRPAHRLLPPGKGPLLFPGKVAAQPHAGTELLAIADTGNNRVLLVTPAGAILHQIGSGRAGLADGSYASAQFSGPQGVAFDADALYVADTANHAIRRVDLAARTVATVVGDGRQGADRVGGKPGAEQQIASPWDVALFETPNMDLTFHADGRPPLRKVLLIAMAGTHQIWALFLEETVWWKCKKYEAGSCWCIAGSGREENRNNAYPQSAAFAQPSGLALCARNKELYIADSESSSVRRLSLADGKVSPVVGGDRNPSNLFAFGDADGTLCEAKLQHALGLAMSSDEATLFVADTYNHKLKMVDIGTNRVRTFEFPGELNEPAGLCVGGGGRRLYIADTNNHEVKVVELRENCTIESVARLELQLAAGSEPDSGRGGGGYERVEAGGVAVGAGGGQLAVRVAFRFGGGLKLAEGAPQRWGVSLPDPRWACVPSGGDRVGGLEVAVSVPPNGDGRVGLTFDLITCTEDACLPKSFMVCLPVGVGAGAGEGGEVELLVVVSPEGVVVE